MEWTRQQPFSAPMTKSKDPNTEAATLLDPPANVPRSVNFSRCNSQAQSGHILNQRLAVGRLK